MFLPHKIDIEKKVPEKLPDIIATEKYAPLVHKTINEIIGILKVLLTPQEEEKLESSYVVYLDLKKSLSALGRMWNQYCGKNGHLFMNAGESASEVLMKHGILKDEYSEIDFELLDKLEIESTEISPKELNEKIQKKAEDIIKEAGKWDYSTPKEEKTLKNGVVAKFGGYRLGGKSYDNDGKEIAEEHEEDCFCCRKVLLKPVSTPKESWNKIAAKTALDAFENKGSYGKFSQIIFIGISKAVEAERRRLTEAMRKRKVDVLHNKKDWNTKGRRDGHWELGYDDAYFDVSEILTDIK